MKAAHFKEKNTALVAVDVARPVPAKGQVLVRLYHGAICEYLVISRRQAVEKPERISLIEPAAVPLSGLTAYGADLKGNINAGW